MNTDTFVIARNRNGRPTLMHKFHGPGALTRCGTSLEGWSRSYQSTPIHTLLCKKCEKLT